MGKSCPGGLEGRLSCFWRKGTAGKNESKLTRVLWGNIQEGEGELCWVERVEGSQRNSLKKKIQRVLSVLGD